MTSKNTNKGFFNKIATKLKNVSLKNIVASIREGSKTFFYRLKHFSARDIVKAIETQWQRLKSYISWAQKTYFRFVVLNNETFEEVGSYRVSLFNIYVLGSSLFVGLMILGIFLVAFTPLKRIIPGYGGYGTERSVFELYQKVDALTDEVRARDRYIRDVKNLLSERYETENDIPKSNNTSAADSTDLNLDATEEELRVRQFQAEGGDASKFVNTDSANNNPKAIFSTATSSRLEQMFLTSPISGEVSLPFALDKKHFGIDIIAAKNTPVKAAADGFIISSDWTLETGNTIVIQHTNNVVTFYKHNAALLKKTGDRVKAGEAIAIVGNTGEQSSGPHLHFELWKDGRPMNPQEYIRF